MAIKIIPTNLCESQYNVTVTQDNAHLFKYNRGDNTTTITHTVNSNLKFEVDCTGYYAKQISGNKQILGFIKIKERLDCVSKDCNTEYVNCNLSKQYPVYDDQGWPKNVSSWRFDFNSTHFPNVATQPNPGWGMCHTEMQRYY